MQQKTVFADPDKEIAFQNICLQVVCNCCAECRKSLCDKGFGILGKDEVASSNLAISSIKNTPAKFVAGVFFMARCGGSAWRAACGAGGGWRPHPRGLHSSASYCASATGSSHSLRVLTPGTSTARWLNQLSFAAPCQCLTPAGMLTASPGVSSRAGSPHA